VEKSTTAITPEGLARQAAEDHETVIRLDERMQYRATERAADFLQLQKLIEIASDLQVSQRVLETRVAIYAGVGGLVGGGVVALLVSLALDFIRGAH
jgi:hypothetical protein